MTLLIERGTYKLGMNKINPDGQIIEHQEPKWEPNSEGGCIVISEVNSEDREVVGEADIFSFCGHQFYILKKIAQMMGFQEIFGDTFDKEVTEEQIELAKLVLKNLHKLDSEAIYDISEIILERVD